jgi:hypothetical protein
MAEIKNGRCTCYDCEQQRKKEEEHLNHPFYKEAVETREEVRIGQIKYGASKYPEPFNPFSWTPKQLLTHARQESVDMDHYLYGLYKWVERLEEENEKGKAAIIENCELRKEIEGLKVKLDYWRAAATLER